MMLAGARSATAARRLAIIGVAVAAVLLAGCEDDDDGVISIGEDDLSPLVTVVERSPAPTSGSAVGEPTPPVSGDTIEVQGIIGAIDHDAGVITINRLQGADVDRIQVGEGTEIRSARGGTISLAGLRVSDRIIAEGVVEGAALLAERIEISQVVPGADPGG